MSTQRKKSSAFAPFREWLKIHAVALGVSGTLIVVLAGVLSLYFIDSRFSPTSEILRGSDGATLQLQISDHNTNTRPSLLPNSLTDPTPPEYSNNLFMELTKADSNIPSLFRIQGTLAYNSPTTTNKATVTIDLPPRLLLTPNQLAFGSSTYTFTYRSDGTPNNPPSKQGNGTENVRIDKINDLSNDVRGESYRVTISNIERRRFALTPFEQTQELFASLNPLLETAQAYSPPPAGNVLIFRRPFQYQFRLTFRNLGSNIAVPAANIDSLVTYVAERGRQDRIFFGDVGCAGAASRAYICAKTITQASSPSTTGTISLPLHQKIELDGVYLAGNVAALVEIQNIKLFPNAIAVGGKLTNVGGTTLNNYLGGNPNSTIRWSNTVDEQITQLFDRRTQGTLATNVTPAMTTWRLNSPTDDPNDSAAPTTFSSPPEGKLWRTGGSLVFSNNVIFSGSGTIVVNGNLVFNGTVNCTGAKRLAFIVRGNITFNGLPNVACGAYMALGHANADTNPNVPQGDLLFNGEPPAGGATARGIFTARNNVQIPNAATAPQMIDYDADFAANPTVLFREFLDLILTSQS